MSIDFLPDKPIYQQLIDRITGEIIRGNVKPGEKLPSVREYAVEVGVNANTMQRVYKELEMMRISETKRGQGTFVTDNETRLQQLRDEVKEGLVESFLNSIEALGFSKKEMIEFIQTRERGEKQ
ncbi:GntR family transcriptional regulator [Psychrobacillus lasiicapitis]|uniref:GntR family transcriptional regulator n=1 Tax=Psychrobacillus lasiicapitis TaxID=1636719 RepID=A0A544TAQ1_9BACI|nr:GntR family transcriptional regulator [Psychrobacillus lasiicapitis]TQR14551.1 GntR family transcriptional regulator [Psychrobacillus lasiicapitis]GGA30422.1 putative HTH-type transcriptional regulator YhcF [Psychrobacillus lasiicapitis]